MRYDQQAYNFISANFIKDEILTSLLMSNKALLDIK